jgi:hypothetical protein
VAEHHRAVPPDDLLVGDQRSANEGGRAERFEEAVGDEAGGDVLGIAGPGEIHADGEVPAHRLSETALRPPVEEVRFGDGAVGDAVAAVGVPDPDDPLGIAEGERLEQDAANHAEDRGVGADAERERQERGRGEARGAAQCAEAVAKILEQLIEERHASSSSFAAQVFCAAVVACEIHIAESAFRFLACIGLGPPRLPEVGRHLLEVELELVVDVDCDLASREPGESKERADARWTVHAGVRTLKSASTYRRSSATSVWSCFRPSRVML